MSDFEQGGPSGDERGPFDDLLRPQTAAGQPVKPGRGSSSHWRLLALGALLLMLVLPPISLLSRGGGGGERQNAGNIKTTARKDMPNLPQGVEAISPFYDISVSGKIDGPGDDHPSDSRARLTDGRNLSVYTNEKGEWQRLGGATLAPDGNAVEAEVTDIPQNIVGLRRSAAARQLIGYLPAGIAAQRSLPRRRSPSSTRSTSRRSSDGSLAGSATSAPLPAGLPVRPAIRVTSSDRGGRRRRHHGVA